MTISRRKLIQVAGIGAAALSLPKKGRAAKKTLRILQWNHFVPGYDKWFNGQYVKEWGAKNDTEVIVDNVGIPAINSTAAAEVAARKGHDLFLFLWPKPVYEDEEVLRVLRQLRARPHQLPLRPVGRDRDEARLLGRHPCGRQEDQGQDRH